MKKIILCLVVATAVASCSKKTSTEGELQNTYTSPVDTTTNGETDSTKAQSIDVNAAVSVPSATDTTGANTGKSPVNNPEIKK